MRNVDALMLTETLEHRLRGDIADQKLFGAAIYVSQKEKVLYNGALGTVDPAQSVPITERTLFRLASMTKPITAVAALILRDRGLLDLNDPVEKYLSDYSAMRIGSVNDRGEVVRTTPAVEKPTIRRILSHTSGIGCGKLGAAQIGAMSASDKANLLSTASYFAKQPLSFEPGTKQE